MITNGTIQLQQNDYNIYFLRYVKKLSIQKIAQQTNTTKYKISKTLNDLSEGGFYRYLKVQDGVRYNDAMSDCQGFINDKPSPYDCLLRIENMDDAKKHIKEGDFVAELGSHRYHTVSKLTTNMDMVFCNTNIISLPVTLIKNNLKTYFCQFNFIIN